MQSLRRHANSIFLCIFEVLIGILVLIDPIMFSSGIIIAAGILLVLAGAGSVIRYFRMEPEEAALSQQLLKGLLFLLVGILGIRKYQWVLSASVLLTMVYGVGILLAGLAKIQWAVDLLRLKRQRWFLPAISAAVSLFCAIVILKNPFRVMEALWIFTGVSLIGESIFDIVSLFLGGPGKERDESGKGDVSEEGRAGEGGTAESENEEEQIEEID